MGVQRKKDVTATTRTQHKESGDVTDETEEVEKVAESVTDHPLCNVGISMSHTKNLGDYESLRIEVSLHVPCENEEIDDAFDATEEWVAAKLKATFEKVMADADSE